MKTPDLLNDDQLKCAAFLQTHEAGIIWADVGTGKTVSTLTALKALIDRFDVAKILVVGPRLVAERVWSTEVNEWAHLKGLRVVRITGTAAQRLRALETPADIHTISRDNVVWLEELFIRIVGTNSKGTPARAQCRRWPWDCVVLDESQSFKAQSSKRFKSIRRLRRLFKRVYLLSGSLMPNGYGDLWSQLYLVDGGKRLGATEEAFYRRWFRKDVNDGIVRYDMLPGAAKEIDRAISDVCLVMRDQQPAVPMNFIRVTLDKREQTSYNRMVRQSVLELNGKTIDAINAGALWNKLTQLANGAVYDGDRIVHLLHNRKIEALVELLESLPRPVLIGYSFIHDVERIKLALLRAGIAKVGVIRSNASLEMWKAKEIQVGIIHPLSAGHGLNDLKDAEAVVWFGLPPGRLESLQQLNGRVVGGHRRQGRSIGVHYIIAENTVDEDLISMLDMKDGTQTTAQIRVAQRLIQQEGPHGVHKATEAADDRQGPRHRRTHNSRAEAHVG